MIKKILLILTISLFPFTTGAGTRFSLNWLTDIASGTIAAGLVIHSFSAETIPSFVMPDEEDINDFDKIFLFEYNSGLDTASLLPTSFTLVLPAASLAGHIGNGNTWLTYGVMYSEALLLTMGTKNLLKSYIVRFRPYTYFGTIPDGEENDFYNSFPSGHTAYAFFGATFLTTIFSYDHPESRWKIPLIAGSYTLASSVAVLRIVSGNHFLSDVLAGAAIGSFYGWLVPVLHVKRDTRVSVAPGKNGLLFCWEY